MRLNRAFYVFRLKGFHFYTLSELTFGENIVVTELFKRKMGNWNPKEVSIPDILVEAYEGGTIAEMFDIVLKPVLPGAPKPSTLLAGMKERKVGRVLSSFFTCNPAWLMRLTATAFLMNLTEEQTATMNRNLKARGLQSFDLQAGITSKLK